MEFEKLIRARYSVRAYKRDPVPDEVLDRVLEAARLAPTAANRQAFRLLVIHTDGREKQLKRIYGRDWFVQGPLVIGVCVLTDSCWVRSDGKSYGEVDAAIVMDHLILAAADQGLGSCWIGAFDARAAREILELPESVEPIAFTPLGYPADSPGAKKRRSVDDLVLFESWG
ncbi:MAG: nitroreductase family protein [Spirochaetaceae bacterium]|nr:MAG: nitroreductase family protein [Spirochaetaceae bacterium]